MIWSLIRTWEWIREFKTLSHSLSLFCSLSLCLSVYLSLFSFYISKSIQMVKLILVDQIDPYYESIDPRVHWSSLSSNSFLLWQCSFNVKLTTLKIKNPRHKQSEGRKGGGGQVSSAHKHCLGEREPLSKVETKLRGSQLPFVDRHLSPTPNLHNKETKHFIFVSLWT